MFAHDEEQGGPLSIFDSKVLFLYNGEKTGPSLNGAGKTGGLHIKKWK